MSDLGHYEFPAWCQMETALDEYQQDREQYLNAEAKKLGPAAERELRDLNQAAETIVKGVETLSGVDGVQLLADLMHSARLQQREYRELLDEHVCISFGWEVMAMLSTARNRFHDLLGLLKNRNPCDRAKSFLKRVSRCYIFGFDAECTVMCRATLDLEFQEQIVDDDQVSEWWKSYANTPEGKKYRGKKPPYGRLWAQIAAAEHAGMISASDRQAADFVREAGNKGVHEKPDAGTALQVVRMTLQVLDAIANDAK